MFVQTQPATPLDELQQHLFALIGGEDPQEVVPLVETQLHVCERELQSIPARAAARGAEFEQATAEPRSHLLEQFRRYQNLLQNLRTALEANDHQGFVTAHEESQAVVPAFLEAMDAYGRAFANFGPYSSPWANTLARLAEGIVSGEAMEEHWDETIASIEHAYNAKLMALQNVGVPGRTACREAYQQSIEALRTLQEADNLQADALKPHLAELEESGLLAERLEKLMAEGMEGPASMPVTNIVILVSRKALAGELDPDMAVSVINDYADMLDKFWEGFEQSVARPAESALVQQEIPRTLEHGDQHDTAVEDLRGALSTNDAAAAEKAIAEMIATSHKIQESREVFDTAAQHQTHAMCPGCGRANPPENRRCEACGNVLMTDAASGSSSTFNVLTGPALEETQELGMTENVRKLFQACDDVADEKISIQTFQAIVQEAAAGLKDFAKEMDEIAADVIDDSSMTDEQKMVWEESHLPYVVELSAHFEAGIADVEAGLMSMLEYVKDPDKELLIIGVRTAWEGLGVIHRARLAMNSNLKMFQDMLEEAREQGLIVDASPEEM